MSTTSPRLRIRSLHGLALWGAACLALAAASLSDGIALAEPLEIFEGVTYEQETRTSPRPLKLHWIEADLSRPGVRFEVTPSNGEAPGEVTATLPQDWLRRLDGQVVLNGDAFSLLQSEAGRPPYVLPGDPLDLQGAAVRNGKAYSQPRKNYGIFYQLNNGRLGVTYPPLPKGARQAVGGYRIVLKGGKLGGHLRASLHPRTVVGCDARRQRLYWLVVDGRQPGKSEGATEAELGEWMRRRGATDALSLDGGGSSLLAINQAGTIRILNRPVGLLHAPGTVRPVGNCLILHAPALGASP